MGIETALIGSAILGGVSSYRTQRANAKMAKAQLSASKEAQKEAEEAEAEALKEKEQALKRERAAIGISLGEGYKTSTGAGIRGYI